MASLKDIAMRAGVSIATVSRILNIPEYNCDKKLRQDVWDIAHEINYIPNQNARNLKSGDIDYEEMYRFDILLTRYNELATDPFFNELYRSIEQEMFRQGCILHKIYNFKECNKEFYDETINKNTGLIILGKCPLDIIENLKNKYKYIIGIDRNPMNYPIDEIFCDGCLAAKRAVNYLIELGHKKIAYIGDTVNESRYQGYVETLSANDILLDKDVVFQTKHTQEEAFNTMAKLYDKPQRPTAIFCANDITAIGVLNHLRSRKYNKYHPSIISIDNISEAQNTKPMLTTINIPKNDMGRLAVNMLIDRMKKNHEEFVHVELQSKLVVRESCSKFIK